VQQYGQKLPWIVRVNVVGNPPQPPEARNAVIPDQRSVPCGKKVVPNLSNRIVVLIGLMVQPTPSHVFGTIAVAQVNPQAFD
jgi:hypothetical protein